MKMKPANKKGVSMMTTAIIAMIILIITAGLIFGAQKKILGIIPKTINKEACRASILFASGYEAQNTFLKLGIKKPSEVCRTEDRCLNSGGECPEGDSETKIKTQEDAKKEIVTSMAECFWQMGEGKLSFVSKEAGRKSVCFICGTVKFDSDAGKNIGPITGFENYLSTNKVPRSNITYAQYLANNPDVKFIGSELTLDPSKEYAVVFSEYSKSYLTELIAGGAAGFGATLVGAKGGAVIGAIGGPVGAAGGALIGGTTAGASTALYTYVKAEEIKGERSSYFIRLSEFSAEELARSCEKIESIS